jgi:hypothetical protein
LASASSLRRPVRAVLDAPLYGGADVVVTAVGPNFAARHNPRTTMTSPPDLHQRLARTLVTAMKDPACASVSCAAEAALRPRWRIRPSFCISASGALGWQVVNRGNYGVSIGVEGSPFEIDFRFVPDGPKPAKNRLHLDVKPLNRSQQAELDRLLALGARPVDVGQGDQNWYVLADPEGNELPSLMLRVGSFLTCDLGGELADRLGSGERLGPVVGGCRL